MQTDRWAFVVGTGGVLFGAFLLFGGMAPAGWIVAVADETPAIPTGVCFLLASAALLLPISRPAVRNRGYRLIAIALLLVTSLALVQLSFGPFVDLDHFVAQHLTALARVHVGSMPLFVALVFAVAGVVLLGAARPVTKPAISLIVVAFFGIFTLGTLDLMVNLFGVDVLFSHYQNNKMSTPIAIASLLLDAGLLRVIYKSGYFDSVGRISQDKKITFIGGAIVLLFGLVAGLAVSGLWARTTTRVIEDSLRISLSNRIRTYRTAVENALSEARLINSQPRLNRLMGEIAKSPGNALKREEINGILDSILSGTGISGVAIYDRAGHEIGQRGEIPGSSPLHVTLRYAPNAVLLWNRHSQLKVTLAMRYEERVVGRMTIIGPLPAIDELMSDVTGLGKTGAMAVCAPSGVDWECSPNRINHYEGIRLTAPMQTRAKAMIAALHGDSGVMYATDPQGKRVLSAYAPIGDSGLGMVVRIRTAELFESVRVRFFEILLLLFGLEIIGLMLLRWQITPLAAELVHEIQERKAAEERLSYLANHDSLTGLPNRSLLNDRLQQAVIDAARHQRVVAVMFLDLDNFKDINDSLGHEAGDTLLQEVARRLTSCVRRGDTVSHVGGDEFTCILADVASAEDVSSVADKILECFTRPCAVAERELFVNVSVGITLYPLDAKTPQDLLKNADIAMYRAKKHGGGSYQYYSADLAVVAAERLALQTDLRHAIANRELLLHYQPQMDLRSGRLIGVEALLRWQHRERGWVEPEQFIPVAEDCGLILPIGDWVLTEACRQMREWHDSGHAELRMAVNLSGRQFRQSNFPDKVARLIAEQGLNPTCLELELTESLLMSDIDGMTAALGRLHELGMTISIDDFGTGYSSLSYLKRFPITVLKIDRSFVEDLTVDSDDAAIVTTVATMAHGLGLKVIAEGVETKEQLAFLRSLDCDCMQGNYFSPPLSAAELTQLLREERRLTA